MTRLPLCRVRSWNDGMTCMSFYILTLSSFDDLEDISVTYVIMVNSEISILPTVVILSLDMCLRRLSAGSAAAHRSRHPLFPLLQWNLCCVKVFGHIMAWKSYSFLYGENKCIRLSRQNVPNCLSLRKLRIISSQFYNHTDLSQGKEHIKCLSGIFCRVCV